MRVLAVAVIFASVACAGPSDKGEKKKDAVTPINSEARMLEHFIELAAVERAVVRGDLAAAKQHADSLAAPRAKDPANWAPHVAALNKAAKAVSGAKTLEMAAGKTSDIVGACAACHSALAVEFQPNWVPDPPPPTTVEEKMRRHQWGIDLMRLSLLFNHQELWTRSSGVLTSAPLHPREITSPGTIDVEIVSHANALRDLAKGAAEKPATERLETYGALLQTCVGCHAKEKTP